MGISLGRDQGNTTPLIITSTRNHLFSCSFLTALSRLSTNFLFPSSSTLNYWSFWPLPIRVALTVLSSPIMSKKHANCRYRRGLFLSGVISSKGGSST